MLIADLGITTYAIREGSKIRSNKDAFAKFANEVFSINLISTFVALLLLSICMISIDSLYKYKYLLLLLSVNIFTKAIGLEWLFSVYEDFLFITIRTIIFQVLSLILLLFFVKTEDDLLRYTLVSLVSSAGINIANWFFSRRYVRVRPIKEINLFKHIKPILILFGMSATVTIYVISDTTILGFLCGDTEVGIYSV